MASSTDRSVRSLRLRVAARADVRRGATLVEDALRTASFAGADGGRMVIIRRLDLGRIARSAGPETVALLMERAYREASSRAVPFDAPGADGADAVFFPSRADGLVALARLFARGVRPKEWFWTTVLPAWDASLGPSAFWPIVFDEAFRLPEAPVASAAIAQEVVRADAIEGLLDAVGPERARAYLSACGWRNLDRSIADGRLLGLSAELADVHRRLARMERSQADVDALWLLTMLGVAERPSRAGDSLLPHKIRQLAADAPSEPAQRSVKHLEQPQQASAADVLNGTAEPRDASAAPLPPPGPTVAQSVPFRPESSAPTAGGAPNDGRYHASPAQAEASVSRDPSIPSPRDIPYGAQLDLPPWAGAPTRCAGLLFLVPVLDLLGISEWMPQEPDLLEAGFPAQLLRSVAEGLGIPEGDPMLVVMESLAGEHLAAPRTSYPTAVRALFSDAGKAPSAEPLAVRGTASKDPPASRRTPSEDPLAVWRTALEIWIERNARLEVRTVVVRPGRVLASRTHLNVFLPLFQLDVRIRRLALDVDPGWVSWLGRVIQFHYWRSYE